jgi:hypothetical protein
VTDGTAELVTVTQYILYLLYIQYYCTCWLWHSTTVPAVPTVHTVPADCDTVLLYLLTVTQYYCTCCTYSTYCTCWLWHSTTVPAVSTVATLPTIHTVPIVPTVPAVHTVPAVPTVPIVLTVPAVPRVPTVVQYLEYRLYLLHLEYLLYYCTYRTLFHTASHAGCSMITRRESSVPPALSVRPHVSYQLFNIIRKYLVS